MLSTSLLSCIAFFIGMVSFAEGSLKFSRTDIFPSMVHFRSANYGYIPYGKILKGDVITSQNSTQRNNCEYKKESHIEHKFLVVTYTECSVITKAYNAQLNKAALLIVVADTDEIDSIHLLSSADKIHIPVLLIGKSDGEKVMNQASNTQNGIMKAECYFPRTVAVNSTFARVDYWFDPMDTSNYKFFYQFSNLHKELGNKVNFNVHLALGFNQENESASAHSKDCVSSGRYCAINTREGGVANGSDIVLTGLAILCLSREDKSYLLTQTLMKFDLMCLIPQISTAEAPYHCLEKVAASMGFNKTNFEKQCFDTTFINGQKTNENVLLKQEMGEFNQEIVQIWPELYVNSRAIRGNIQSLDNVESAVCGGYSEPAPSACYEYFEEQTDDSFSAGTIIMIIMLSAGFMFAVLFGVFRFYYHRKFKQQIDSEVNQVISKYISFQEESHE